jgi:hypothetical protein
MCKVHTWIHIKLRIRPESKIVICHLPTMHLVLLLIAENIHQICRPGHNLLSGRTLIFCIVIQPLSYLPIRCEPFVWPLQVLRLESIDQPSWGFYLSARIAPTERRMICYSSNSRMGRRGYDVAEGDSCVGAWFRGVAALKVAGVDWSCHDCCAVRSICHQRK